MIVNCPSCSTQFHVPAEVVPAGGRNLRCSSCGHVWHFPHPDDMFEADTPEFLKDLPRDDEGQASNSAPADFAQVLANEMKSGEVVPPLPQPEVVKPVRRGPPPVTKRPFWRFDDMGRRGYAAAILVFALTVFAFAVIHQPLVRIMPWTAPLYTLFGAPAPQPVVDTSHIPAPDITMGLVNVTQPDPKNPKRIKVDGILSNNADQERAVPAIRIKVLGDKPGQVLANWTFKPSTATLAAGETAPFDSSYAIENLGQVKNIDLQFIATPQATSH